MVKLKFHGHSCWEISVIRAQWVATVGMLVALLAVDANSESIPLDYWYGRIVGGHLTIVEFDDAKYYRSKFQLSQRIGDREDFDVTAARFFRLWPSGGIDPLGVEPILSANLRLSAATRLRMPELDYRRVHYSAQYEAAPVIDSTRFSLNIELNHISNGGLVYSEDRSLFVVQEGAIASRGETTARINVKVRSYSGHKRQDSRESLPYVAASHVDDTAIEREIRVEAQRGFSRKITLGIGARYSYQGNDASRQFTEIWLPPRADSIQSSLDGSLTEDRGDFSLHALYFIRPAAWGKASLSYYHHITRRTSESRSFEEDLSVRSEYHAERYGSSAELRFTLFSRTTILELARLLDNYSGYYEDQLESGIWSFEASLKWSVDERRYSSNSLGGQRRRNGLHYNSVYSRIALRYFAQDNLHVKGSIALASVSDSVIAGDRPLQIQTANLRLSAGYQSFHWDRNERRDIAWDNVSALDYLLSPQLRAGDFRLQISVAPPYLLSRKIVDNSWAPSAADFEWDKDWVVEGGIAVGVAPGIEAGMEVSWRYLEYNEYSGNFRTNQWSLKPSLSLQYRTRCRLSTTLTDNYVRDDTYSWKREGFERDWQLAVRLDVLY